MSIRLLSAAWDLAIDSTEKMVLMCLCDHANDDGLCWPSVATIGRKCSKSERTVQSALKWLNDNNYFRVEDRPGKGRLYFLNPRKICTPAKSAPPQDLQDTPAKSAPHPRKSRTQTTIEPSRTVNRENAGASAGEDEQSEVRHASGRGWPEIPDWIPAEQWNGFIDMRKRKRANPTPRAIELLIIKLDRLRTAGNDPGQVLDQSTVKNWTDVFELKERSNGSTPGKSPHDSRDGFERALDRRIFGEGADGPAVATG